MAFDAFTPNLKHFQIKQGGLSAFCVLGTQLFNCNFVILHDILVWLERILINIVDLHQNAALAEKMLMLKQSLECQSCLSLDKNSCTSYCTKLIQSTKREKEQS